MKLNTHFQSTGNIERVLKKPGFLAPTTSSLVREHETEISKVQS